MAHLTSNRITRAWLLLVLLTLLSLGAGHFGPTGLAANGLILVAAFAKGRWMLMDFLKLRGTPPAWRALFLSWLALVTALPWLASAIAVLRTWAGILA